MNLNKTQRLEKNVTSKWLATYGILYYYTTTSWLLVWSTGLDAKNWLNQFESISFGLNNITTTNSEYMWSFAINRTGLRGQNKEFEDTKEVIRTSKSKKDRQHNDQMKKDKKTNNDLQNIQIHGGERGWTQVLRKGNSSYSTSVEIYFYYEAVIYDAWSLTLVLIFLCSVL